MSRERPTLDDSVREARVPKARTRWAWTLGTFFGAGLLKPGPGTWGSVAALLLWLIAAYPLHATSGDLTLLTCAGALLAIALGTPAATIVAAESGREDPQHVVIDEVAGQWIALIPCSWPAGRHAALFHIHWGSARPSLPHALLALVLFRVFDILKPPPCRQLERLDAGAGITLDDVAAGIYAAVLGWAIYALVPAF